MVCPGIEGGFDVEQELYEEDVKVVILPDRQEVTSEDLATMPDVVRERVSYLVCFVAKTKTVFIDQINVHTTYSLNTRAQVHLPIGICRDI